MVFILVAGLVDGIVVAGGMECPGRLEVVIVDGGGEPEDGLGARDAPPGAGDAESVTDEMPACALHYSSGDRPAGRECLVVAQVLLVVRQVAHARVHAGSLTFCQPALAGLRGEELGHLPGPAAHHPHRPHPHPLLPAPIPPPLAPPTPP